MKILELLLEEYKEFTLKLISAMDNDNDLEKLLDERQKILDEIEELNSDKKEFTKLAENLDIIKLEEELKNKLSMQKMKVRKELETLRKQRQARKSYAQKGFDFNFYDRTT